MAEGALLPRVGNEMFWIIFNGIVIIVIGAVIMFKRIFNSNPQSARSTTNQTSQHQSYNNEVCPLCISPQVLPVETNCGHKFCGSCLRTYLNNRIPGDFSVFSGRLSCPLCRQDINVLLLNFTQEEIQSTTLKEERNKVESTVNSYNVRFGNSPRSLWSYVKDSPVLIRHMFINFFSLDGVVRIFKIHVFLCFLAYFIYMDNSIFFVPEAIFHIFGFLDDIIVYFLCAAYVGVIYRIFAIRRGYSQ